MSGGYQSGKWRDFQGQGPGSEHTCARKGPRNLLLGAGGVGGISGFSVAGPQKSGDGGSSQGSKPPIGGAFGWGRGYGSYCRLNQTLETLRAEPGDPSLPWCGFCNGGPWQGPLGRGDHAKQRVRPAGLGRLGISFGRSGRASTCSGSASDIFRLLTVCRLRNAFGCRANSYPCHFSVPFWCCGCGWAGAGTSTAVMGDPPSGGSNRTAKPGLFSETASKRTTDLGPGRAGASGGQI